MKCKYAEQNLKENKCSDYYYSHGETKHGIFCRLKEWKKKQKVCPYDNRIRSVTARPKGQKTLL
jgi:hypothetical protein